MPRRHAGTAAESYKPDSELMLSYEQVRERYDVYTRGTIIAWRRNRNFPAPERAGGRNYWRLTALLEWEKGTSMPGWLAWRLKLPVPPPRRDA